jgi:hypothetical protein
MIQSSVPEPIPYLLYIADFSVALGSTTAIYMDDTAVLIAHNNHLEASLRLQKSRHHIRR